MNKIGRIEALDSVRGIAAFIVVIHHCFLVQPVYSDFFFSHWKTNAADWSRRFFFIPRLALMWAGYEAVTLFYVLSGLVLALPWIEGRPVAYKKFAIRRMCRLYIPYVVDHCIRCGAQRCVEQHAYVSGASTWVNEMTWTQSGQPIRVVRSLGAIGHHATINGVTHTLIWEIRESLFFPLIIVPDMSLGRAGCACRLSFLLAVIVGMQMLDGNIRRDG